MADAVQAALHAQIADYYSRKIQAHGATPRGVDWACEPTQQLRFIQLLKVCDFTQAFSLNDIGCGYGALLGFLRTRHRRTAVDYAGVDLSAAMVAQARQLWARKRHCSFDVGNGPLRRADVSVASGIFNVKLDQPTADWEDFVQETLSHMLAMSDKAIAVNFLMQDAELDEIPQLYRCLPQRWAGALEGLGAKVDILQHYGMLEFTLLARR